jgi:nucleotide-binding universal stress UspA family protein
VRQEIDMDDRPILICYDGSRSADQAIGAAAELLGPRRAVVLDVGPLITETEVLASYVSVAGDPGFAEMHAEDALAVAQKGAARARSAGFLAEARGDAAAPTYDGIVAAADAVDAALIVLGSRGLDGARELLEGSVSHRVAQHAGRPVLIVPPAQSQP